MNQKPKTISEALQDRMFELGMNQTQAAREMGIPQGRISLWVTGRKPGPPHAATLLRFLNVTPVDFAIMLLLTDWRLAAQNEMTKRDGDASVIALNQMVDDRATGWELMTGGEVANAIETIAKKNRP